MDRTARNYENIMKLAKEMCRKVEIGISPPSKPIASKLQRNNAHKLRLKGSSVPKEPLKNTAVQKLDTFTHSTNPFP